MGGEVLGAVRGETRPGRDVTAHRRTDMEFGIETERRKEGNVM
jgi:hypothetical protein